MAEAMINERHVQATLPTLPPPSSCTQQVTVQQFPAYTSNDSTATDCRDPNNTSDQRKYKVNFELPPAKRSKRDVNDNIHNVIAGK